MKKIVMPIKRPATGPADCADTAADKPRERRRLGLNYGGAGGEPVEEGRPS